MGISAQQVKELREKTGAGMMDCKKALVEAEGDMEKAVRILRERGIAAAAKKATRKTTRPLGLSGSCRAVVVTRGLETISTSRPNRTSG